MSFAPGFTPTFELTIPADSENLYNVENITVDIATSLYRIVKDGLDVYVSAANKLEVSLTQEESLKIRSSIVSIQINWTYPGSMERWGTDIATVKVDKQLHMEAIGNE